MKVIATDITNLTDARYFAAWGVDALCYNIEANQQGSLSIDTLKEIVGWVEGPQTALKIVGLELPEELNSLSEEIEMSKIILGPFVDTQNIPPSIQEVYRICTLCDGWQDSDHLILTLDTAVDKLSNDQISKIKNLCTSKTIYLDGIFKVDDLETIHNLGLTGVILKGGEEEKVGFKSFDELDDILEALYDEV